MNKIVAKKKMHSSQGTRSVDRSQEVEFVQNYTELKVYQVAFESAMRIYEHSKKWPSEEKYSLTDQIRRSSRSVGGNIAEAWRKRRYPAHFVSKLSVTQIPKPRRLRFGSTLLCVVDIFEKLSIRGYVTTMTTCVVC